MRVTQAFEFGFRARMLQECLSSALPSVWERRAQAWEAARPRQSDFNGRASSVELRDRDERCRDMAESCRRHARLLHEAEPTSPSPQVIGVLLEAA